MSEKGAPSETRKKHKYKNENERRVCNDAITRSGLNSEEIFMAIKKLLRCTVCFECHSEVNQCRNGHLICRRCTHHLESGTNQEAGGSTCPTCRTTLFPGISRCLLATQLSCELPNTCSFCGLYFRQSELEHHEISVCPLRPVKCRYDLFGCKWKGNATETSRHERNCSVSRRQVREVESAINEKLYQRTIMAKDSTYYWQDMVKLLRERPLGVFVCIREAILGQRERRKKEICFQGTRLGNFNVTIELIFNLDESKFYYSIKFASGCTETMKFRLLNIYGDKLVIPVIDRLHVPNSNQSHDGLKFHCNINLPDTKHLFVAKKFSDFAINLNLGLILRLEFLMIFENLHAIRMYHEEPREWNTVTPISPTDLPVNEEDKETSVMEDLTRINSSRDHENDSVEEDDATSTSLMNISRSQIDNSWSSFSQELNHSPELTDGYRVVIDTMTEGVVLSMNEATNLGFERGDVAQILREEELPFVAVMRNNNASEEPEVTNSREREIESKSGCRNGGKISKEDDSSDDENNYDKSAIVLRSGTQLKFNRRSRSRLKASQKGRTSIVKRIDQICSRIAPYLTRGHMWQNIEAMNHNTKRLSNITRCSKIRKARRIARTKKPIATPSSHTALGLRDHMVLLLAPFSSCWNTMKKVSIELFTKGQKVLQSFRRSDEEANPQNTLMIPMFSRRTAATEWFSRPQEEEILARSGGDTPGWIFS